MKVVETELPGVKLIEPKVFRDSRGFFYESWNERTFAEAGLPARFVQSNHSRSSKNVLRGLHYQIHNTQAKLIRVISGSVYDVAVDLRKSSPYFGRSFGAVLSAENMRQLWIPEGFAHGFLCLEDNCEFLYSCTDFYAPQHERSLQWNDPVLGIDWPLNGEEPILSAKDASAKPLSEVEVFP